VRLGPYYLAFSFVIFSSLVFSSACSGARGLSSSSSGSGSPQRAVPQFGHVVLVVEENHSYSSVIGSSAMPYLNSLAPLRLGHQLLC
jgi:hypothetical protein